MALSQTAQNLLSAMNTQQIRNVLLREDTYEQKQVSFSAKKISKTRLQKSQQTPGSKTKRTLNSYIIFRSYYQVLFNGEQKHSSRALSDLWKEEKDRGKWQMLARVFTVVRNEEKKHRDVDVDLKAFLDIAAPLVGALDPLSYSIFIEHKAKGLSFPDPEILQSAKLAASQISDLDLVSHCRRAGLYTGLLNRNLFSKNAESLSIRTISRPTQTVREQSAPQLSSPSSSSTSRITQPTRTLIEDYAIPDMQYPSKDLEWAFQFECGQMMQPQEYSPYSMDPFDPGCLSHAPPAWLSMY